MTGVAKQAEQAPEIEFWFEFGSNYSYLSVMRIEVEAGRHGVRIAWKPFLLGPIFPALGMENSPFVLQKEKGAYVQQDMARLCRKYGLGPGSSLACSRVLACCPSGSRYWVSMSLGSAPSAAR
jgi:2-hydroxychromene-2-carboxylate isomerase